MPSPGYGRREGTIYRAPTTGDGDGCAYATHATEQARRALRGGGRHLRVRAVAGRLALMTPDRFLPGTEKHSYYTTITKKNHEVLVQPYRIHFTAPQASLRQCRFSPTGFIFYLIIA